MSTILKVKLSFPNTSILPLSEAGIFWFVCNLDSSLRDLMFILLLKKELSDIFSLGKSSGGFSFSHSLMERIAHLEVETKVNMTVSINERKEERKEYM